MRNLVIKRNKSLVGCFAKFKVYIEDYTASEIKINNVPCRKLGTLKNGEEKSFLIPDTAVRVFVIADKLSRNYCNEFYNIPEGQSDVFLNGQCRFNPASGNAFRFDDVTDEDVLQNRKKGTKKGVIVLVVAMIVGFTIGFLSTSGLLNSIPEPKQFSVEEMQITLTDEFTNIPMGDFNACFGTEDVAVLVLKEEFELMEGLKDYSLEEYGELVIQANGLEGIAELNETDGIMYYEYEAEIPDENEVYYYYSTIFKSEDGFWNIQFAVLTEDTDYYLPYFIEWAKTITFKNSI